MRRGRAALTVAVVATVGLLAACADPSPRPEGVAPSLHPFGSYRTLAGDTVVEVTFTGFTGGSGPCGADYHAVASETAERVYVQVQILREPEPHSGAACARSLRPRTVSVTLGSPIEGRAVVDAATGELVVGGVATG